MVWRLFDTNEHTCMPRRLPLAWRFQRNSKPLRALRGIGACLLGLALCTMTKVRADDSSMLLEQFAKEYPQACAALQGHYDSVRIFGILERFDDRGRFSHKTQFEIFKDGQAIRLNHTVSEDNDGRVAAGTKTSVGGTSAKAFSVEKTAGNADYSLTRFGRDDQLQQRTRFSCFPAFAPYAVNFLSGPLSDALIGHEHVRPISARELMDGELPTLEIVFEKPGPKDGRLYDKFCFLKDSWALTEWTVQTPLNDDVNVWRGRVNYRSDGAIPTVRRAEFWHETTTDKTKRGQLIFDVERVEFASTDPAEFTLASLNMEEPLPSSPSDSRYFLIVANALAVAILGAWLWYRRRGTT
jgi:hypothetical protein